MRFGETTKIKPRRSAYRDLHEPALMDDIAGAGRIDSLEVSEGAEWLLTIE